MWKQPLLNTSAVHEDPATCNEDFFAPSLSLRYVPPIVTHAHGPEAAKADQPGVVDPLTVAVGFDNFEILKIDDRDFTVEMNAYLIVKWTDMRIVVNLEQVSQIS